VIAGQPVEFAPRVVVQQEPALLPVRTVAGKSE
jgi:hypothetical protein